MNRIIIIVALLAAMPLVSFAAIDAPHNTGNELGCESCHFASTTSPFWGGAITPADMDDTIYNRLCNSCHKGESQYSATNAPRVQTHSDIAMGNIPANSKWTVECLTCHHPHYQRQFVFYRNSSPSLVYLARGIVTGISYKGVQNDPIRGMIHQSEITYTYATTTIKPDWTDPSTWAAKTGTARGAGQDDHGV